MARYSIIVLEVISCYKTEIWWESSRLNHDGGGGGAEQLALGLGIPASSPGPTVTVAWVLRGKHSRKRAVGPGRKCRKKCMIQRKSGKIVFY